MSGAKNCPETTRQKMIGMMYLVLTAMLALNVSSDILNGFTMVDNSLHTSIESAELRNNALYQDFKDLYSKNPTKVKEWLDKANSIKKSSDDLYNYIEKFKVDIVKLADKDNADPKAREIESRDNLDIAGQYAILEGNGKRLKKRIEDYRELLIKASYGNEKKQKMYADIFNTKPARFSKKSEIKPWEISMFEMMPVSAVVTMLTKYQNDIRASEAEIVQYLKSQTDASDYRVNKLEAMVVPNSKMVFKGDKYSARIVLAAIDSTKVPQVFVNGGRLNGNLYEVGVGAVGPKRFAGEIRMAGNDGNVKVYPFASDYMVMEPTATIQNEDLNVVYRGIENKFSVSAAGVAPENIDVRATGGTVSKRGNGKYIINPGGESEMRISVYGKIGNKMMPMGGGVYRVKRLPKPTAYIQTPGGDLSQGGSMTMDQLRGAAMVASYGQDALIQAKFRVTKFTLLADGITPQQVSGTALNAAFLAKLTKGKNLIISSIMAVGPDGYEQNLGAMVIRLL